MRREACRSTMVVDLPVEGWVRQSTPQGLFSLCTILTLIQNSRTIETLKTHHSGTPVLRGTRSVSQVLSTSLFLIVGGSIRRASPTVCTEESASVTYQGNREVVQ